MAVWTITNPLDFSDRKNLIIKERRGIINIVLTRKLLANQHFYFANLWVAS